MPERYVYRLQSSVREAGAHMLDVGLSSTDHIAAFFGIAPLPAAKPHELRPSIESPAPQRRPAGKEKTDSVQAVIEKALKAAGLMS